MQQTKGNPFARGHTIAFGIGSSDSSAGLSFDENIAPITSYILYVSAYLSSFFLSSNTSILSDRDKMLIVLTGKLFVLVLDTSLLVFSTSLFIRMSYSKFKQQIRLCYLSIILLCPLFFVREYMHLDYHNIGYHLLFIVLFMFEEDELLVLGALSGVLLNIHHNYALMVPFIFAGAISRSKQLRFSREFNHWRLVMTLYDCFLLLVPFLLVYALILMPWYATSENLMDTLYKALGAYLSKSIVCYTNCRKESASSLRCTWLCCDTC